MSQLFSKKEQVSIVGTQHLNRLKTLDNQVKKKQEEQISQLREEIHAQLLKEQGSTKNPLNKSTGIQFPKLQQQQLKNNTIPASLPIKQKDKKYRPQQSYSYAPNSLVKEIQDQQKNDINLAINLQLRKKGDINKTIKNQQQLQFSQHSQQNQQGAKIGQHQLSKTLQLKEQVNSQIKQINKSVSLVSNRYSKQTQQNPFSSRSTTNMNQNQMQSQNNIQNEYFLGSKAQQEMHLSDMNSSYLNDTKEKSQIYSTFKLKTEANIEIAIEDDQILKKRRLEAQELFKNSQYLKIHQRLINHVLIYSKLQYDSIFEQYTLFPDKERSNLERQIGIENAFMKLLHDIHDHFINETENLRNYKQIFDQNNKRMEQMKEENGMLVEQLNIAMKAISQIDLADIKKNIMKKEKEENELKTENSKLHTEVVKLSYKYEQFEKNENVNSLKEKIQKMSQEYQQRFKDQEEQIEYKDQILKKTTQSLMSTKSQCKKQETEIEYYSQKTDELENQVEKLTERSRKLDLYREKMQMQIEDFIGMENKHENLQIMMKDMQKKMKKMQDTIDKFEKKQEIGMFIPENPQFTDQKYYFQELNKMNSINKTFQKMGRTEVPDVDYETIEKKLNRLQNWIEDNKDNLKLDPNSDNPDSQSFDVNKFTVFRPTFFTFIKTKYNAIIKSSPEQLRVTLIKPEFIATLRSILDAKYNEYLSTNSYRQYTKLGDFTFSFLGNFKIDNITRKIKVNSETMYNSFASDDHRFQFYVNLHAPILDQTWDAIVFREFLNEDCTNDEIFFYLHCRYLLFRGPQMEHHQAYFHPIHLVKWKYAERCINLIMAKYDMANIDFVESALKKKFIKTTKDQEYMIDSGLVLKTLLEYYRVEKVNKYKLIRDLFFNQQGNSIDGRYSITFDGFRKIFDNNNFPNTTELEKAQLFRESFALGKGVVSPEVFFAVCNDTNFFVKQLRFKSEKVIPQFSKEVRGYEPRNQLANILGNLNETLNQDEETYQNIYILQEMIQCQGSEEVYKRVEDDIFKIKNDIEIKDEDLNGRNAIWFLKRMMDNLMGVIYTEIISQSQNEDMFQFEYKIVNEYMSGIIEYLNDLAKFLKYKKKKQDFEVKVRVSRFQKMARKKVLKYYQMLNALLSTKQMMEKDQKNQN